MHLNRRTFLYLSAVFAAGCASTPGGSDLSGEEKTINAGSAAQYLKDGVYDRYRDLGFFIVRRGANLFAVSSICTHRKCKLDAEKDTTFYCPCHGSTFDSDGHVTEGPARRDLPRYEISTSEKGELLVKVAADFSTSIQRQLFASRRKRGLSVSRKLCGHEKCLHSPLL